MNTDDSVSNAVSVLIRVAHLCLLQLVLMTALSLLLYVVAALSYAVYDSLGGLENVLPVFWRYKDFLSANGNANNFPTVFSISLMNIVVHVLFLILICRLLFNRINFRSAERISLKRNLLFVALLALTAVFLVELFVGPLDLNSIWGPGIPNAPISVTAVYFRNCVLAPAANITFAFMIVTRFGLSAALTQRNYN